MLKKQIKEGSLDTAFLCLLREGGQVFPGRDGTDGITWLKGSKQTIFWLPDSERHKRMISLAQELGYPEPELATGGSLVRHVLEMAGIEYKCTYPHHVWKKQAEEGWHWHYQHWVKGLHGYCIEIDLKSAYWTTFTNHKSSFLYGTNKWVYDNGGLSNLKLILAEVPKWFRLLFLGVLASWKIKFYRREKSTTGEFKIGFKEIKKIQYGALFNAVHRSILETYEIMRRCHQIVGEDCVRIHTDSLLCKIDNGMTWHSILFEYLKYKGHTTSIKKMGDTWLHDQNCGIVGRYPIGSRRIALQNAKEESIRLKPLNDYCLSVLKTSPWGEGGRSLEAR